MNRKATIHTLFFLSGAACLLSVVAWSRLLPLLFGGTAHGNTALLASFLSGLAFGGWILGKRTDRAANPLRLFGRVEIGLAAASALVPLFAWIGRAPFLAVASGLEEGPVLLLVRCLAGLFALFIPASLMGGTVPLMVRLAAGKRERVGPGVGLLSFFLMGGGALGAMGATFLAIPLLGPYGSIGGGVLVHLAVGFAAFFLGGPVDEPASGPGEEPPPEIPIRRWVLPLLALSGFAALGCGLAWGRVLLFFLGGDGVFAFAVMPPLLLGGLALGGGLYGALLSRTTRPLLFFGLLEFGIALAALLSLRLFGMEGGGTLPPTGMAAAGPILLLPAVLFGAAVPATIHGTTRSGGRVGRDGGTAFALHTAGAALGSATVLLLLVPALGVLTTLLLLTSVHLGVAGAVFLLAGRRRPPWIAAAGVLLAGALLVPAAGEGDGFSEIYRSAAPGMEPVFRDEGAAATVSVHADRRRKTKTLLVNGMEEVSTDFGSLEALKFLGHVGALMHPEPKRGLVLSLGAGITLGSLALHPLDELTCADARPEAKGGALLFAEENGRVLEDPRLRLLSGDGRSHLLVGERRYDLIVSGATHPCGAGGRTLYTKDFYELVLSRLDEKGLFCQWLPYRGIDASTYRTILRTFRSAFPHAVLYGLSRHSILVGSARPIRLDIETMRQRTRGAVRDDLLSVGLDDPLRIAAALARMDGGVDDAAGTGGVNTDARPRNGFAGLRGRVRNTPTEALAVAHAVPPEPFLYCVDFDEIGVSADTLRARVGRIRRAWEFDREALVREEGGRAGEARRAWEEGLRADPENRGVAALYAERLLSDVLSPVPSDDPEPTVSVLRKRVGVVPWDPDAHFRLADDLLREGRTTEALAEYERGLLLDPGNEIVDQRIRELRRRITDAERGEGR